MKRKEVYRIIDGERDYQDKKWGGKKHDEANTISDWIYYMESCLEDAKGYYVADEIPQEAVLDELRQVVALGIACMEVLGVPERILIEPKEYV